MSNIWVFDFEVTAYDWLFVGKYHREDGQGRYVIVHNDHDTLTAFIENEQPMLCGFNNKHYDAYILRAILGGLNIQQVKQVNDYIIGGGNGFDCPLLKGLKVPWFGQMDVRDDMQDGLSLKAIEGHLGMDIRESTVSFDIDHEWSQAELDEMVYYCKHDVDATEEILRLRKRYFDTKVDIGRMVGIPEDKALGMTNAKLTAAFLQAQPVNFNDERCYRYPSNLRREFIPQEVFDFFDRMYDPKVTDEELFSSKIEIDVGGTKTSIGFGGIHSAIPNYIFEDGAHVEDADQES